MDAYNILYDEMLAAGMTPAQISEAMAEFGAGTTASTLSGTGYGARARAARSGMGDMAGAIAMDATTDALLSHAMGGGAGTAGAGTGGGTSSAGAGAGSVPKGRVYRTAKHTSTGGAKAPKGRFTKPGGFFDKTSGKLSGLFNNIANPQFDYNWTPVTDASSKSAVGLQGWGKNLGGMYNVGNTAIQGIKAAKGLQGIADTRDNLRDRMSDITLGASNSPTIMYDLNADQRQLLRELQRGGYDNSADIEDIDLLGVLGDTAMGALGGLPGGLPGVIIGGVGGLANSVIGDFQAGADRDAAELEALYQAVLESERYHNEKRKQQAYAGLY